jgi:class 3 adenylate cyclase/tetratricopeptide (TPR) repeat protein
LQAGQKFCAECGTPLTAAVPAGAVAPPSTGGGARAERRLVTVLFADLVSFTTLSEHRDPEVVRDMLEQYFERCRSTIQRYGGVVEKFIGDAVMAVWGTPVAREDDAERAVRCALDLVASVAELGERIGMPELRVRAGLLTGETAVNVGAEHEGMVIGDAVNTASRIQSLAEPSTVLVEDRTRRATERAIQYTDAGTHEVKGRAQPVHVHRALRVLGGVGGTRRGSGLEAPFAGRERELRAIIAASERVVAQRRAERVVVLGDAGMGKSRLAWEYEKYSDGIADHVLWHRGRCLSYGEGVSYWALAEVVRTRARIAEGEPDLEARAKLRATVEEYVTDDRERRLVLPRLEHLLGLAERSVDAGDLFSGWRLFLERMAAVTPVVIVFEDLHWADNGLLEFIDHLVEWASESPILILALGRPEVLERRPDWQEGAHRLAPLDDDAMTELLRGLVPGLPPEPVARIRDRAEGIPLYAVETVRMLLDRGVLAQEGAVYVVTGDVGDVEVPDTLHALVASRLDGLTPAERRLVQDASVLGQTFSPDVLAELAEVPRREVDALLAALVVKQVFLEDRDPSSPERGQFGFVQALLKTVAYGTLGRRDRKARHLAAVASLEAAFGGSAGDYAEVLASHLEEAVRADPEATDVASLRVRASDTLADAGRRALSFGLGAEARRRFDRAADLAATPLRQAELLDLAGQGALLADEDDADAPFERAASLLEAEGQTRAALVVRARKEQLQLQRNRFVEAVPRLEAILGELGTETVDGDVAFVAGLLVRAKLNTDDTEGCLAPLEIALSYAERAGEVVLLADLLVTRGAALDILGRPREAAGVVRHALEIALEHDVTATALRAYWNLMILLEKRGRYAGALELGAAGIALAERAGDRYGLDHVRVMQVLALLASGRWDEVLELRPHLPRDSVAHAAAVRVHAERGDSQAAREALAAARAAATDDPGTVIDLAFAVASEALAGGRPDEAFAALAPHVATLLSHGTAAQQFGVLLEAAVAAGRFDEGQDAIALLLAAGDPWASPDRDAHLALFRGRVALAAGERSAAEVELDHAVGWARESEDPFLLGRCLLELGELRGGTADDPLLTEARELFTGLRATPWVERVDAVGAPVGEAVVNPGL